MATEWGSKKAALRYDAFGKTVFENNASGVKYRFSSKEWDSDAQLYYYGFRYYDPERGIWISKDPIGLSAGDLNVYRMVFNNPMLFVDVYGLSDALNPENMKKWAASYAIKAGAGLALVGTGIAGAGIGSGDMQLALGGSIVGVIFMSMGAFLLKVGIDIKNENCNNKKSTIEGREPDIVLPIPIYVDYDGHFVA